MESREEGERWRIYDVGDIVKRYIKFWGGRSGRREGNERVSWNLGRVRLLAVVRKLEKNWVKRM
jgi:hypothetical protein